MFMSRARLSSYENAGHNEIYLYDASEPVSATNPKCVSCNKRVAAATSDAFLEAFQAFDAPNGFDPHLTHNLSADGTRVFFDTAESLVPQDTNGESDVYEWEQEGAGNCASGEGVESGGCLYLISTGESSEEAKIGDESENGNDVLFFTRQSLVSQDDDNTIDVYDARVEGGLESQNPVAPNPCEACRGSAPVPPSFAAPASGMSSGPGNLPPPGSTAAGASSSGPKPLTRARKLANALQACEKLAKRKRARCRAQAEKRYGVKAKKSKKGAK